MHAKGILAFPGLLITIGLMLPACKNHSSRQYEVSNSSFHIGVSIKDSIVYVVLKEKYIPLLASEGEYIYRAQVSGVKDTVFSLLNPEVNVFDQNLTIRGKLAGLNIEHIFFLSKGKSYFEEHIILQNPCTTRITLSEFEMGFPLKVRDKENRIITGLADDRIVAIPFRHRADDKEGIIHDYSITELMEEPGWEYCPNCFRTDHFIIKSRHHFSEAWAWIHGDRSIGIFSFNQDNLVYSVLSPVKIEEGTMLRFGGACFLPIHSQPSAITRMGPGESVDFGITRYQSISGNYNETAYAYRAMLDDKGCRFSEDFDPPVHWEQLYDMEGAWWDRIRNYTKSKIKKEAEKGVNYSCEALYLDPGWDTNFGSFIWGDKWLGPRKAFIDEIKSRYGLKVSLHTAMPSWTTTNPGSSFGPDCVSDWPAKSKRTEPQKTENDTIQLGDGPEICMGSKAFLNEAEKRLLANCEEGVVFLMFDGVGWNGPCSDLTHGHPVPYLQEDYMRDCIDLVKRIHANYPDVLIELHDMLASCSPSRMTPVYYKFGLPLSYDENWGFELMWDPMEDIRKGRGLAMYYYNLACNIPLYLHIDLRKDNEYCFMLWWFASTVRHLGIGGTNKNPKIVKAQQTAMKYYRKHERFYKRGEFYGINEEIHLHVLPGENAFMVNIFNLSDKPKTITGYFRLKEAGLEPSLSYMASKPWAKICNGILEVSLEMPPWSAEVADVFGFKIR